MQVNLVFCPDLSIHAAFGCISRQDLFYEDVVVSELAAVLLLQFSAEAFRFSAFDTLLILISSTIDALLVYQTSTASLCRLLSEFVSNRHMHVVKSPQLRSVQSHKFALLNCVASVYFACRSN